MDAAETTPANRPRRSKADKNMPCPAEAVTRSLSIFGDEVDEEAEIVSCTSSEQDGDVDTSGELTPTLEDPLGVRSSRLPSLSGSSGDEQKLRGATTGEVHLTGNQGFAVEKDTGSPGPSSSLRIRSQPHNLRRTVRDMRLRETTLRRRLRGLEAVQSRLTAAVESVQSELSACFVRRRVSQHECLHVKTRNLQKRVEERLHEAHTMQLGLS